MQMRINKFQRHLINHFRYSFFSTSSCSFPLPSCKKKSTPSVHQDFNELKAPVARKIPVAITAHGRTWYDPYQWMSNIQDPALTRHLNDENSYTEAFMADTIQLQQQLQAEMQSRIPPEVSTPPERWVPWFYYQRIPEGKEYPVLCRRMERQPGLATSFLYYVRRYYREEVLLDWNEIAEKFGYVHVGMCRISPDHRYLAYTLDVTGRELFMLHVKDLKTGSILSNTNVEGVVSLAWAKDGQTLLYTVIDDLQRPYKVFGRRMDSEYEDMLLFEEKDKSCCVDITSTKDCQFITINSNSRTSSEVYLMDAADVRGGLQRIRERECGVQYFVEHHDGFFYILTNAPLEDGKMVADNYQLARCSVRNIASNKWQNVVQVTGDVTIEDMDMFDKHLVLVLHKRGIPVICSLPMPLQIDLKDGMQLEDLNPWFLPMPVDMCTVVPGSNHDFKSSIFRAVISSPVMPEAVVDYDLSRRHFTLVHQEEVKGVSNNSGKSRSLINHGESSEAIEVPEISSKKVYNPKGDQAQAWSDLSELYYCERIEVFSHDAVKIHLTIIRSQEVKQNSKNPGLIYGYGAYGEVLDKSWRSDQMSLLDRGWVLAFADVRGGGGGGKSWHDAGRGLQKPNSIYDFIACSKYLVEEGYVHKDLLGAMAFSAGGILIGAAVNMCPDLFRTIVLKVPFLDICNTLMDPSLPLTVLDYEEFGDPKNFNDFATIQSYSPYDNVQKGVCYPAMLVTASFHDTRVGVWEAAKWVARVREYIPVNCCQPILLKTNMHSGHFGEGGRYEHCKDTSFEYAFLIKMMGT